MLKRVEQILAGLRGGSFRLLMLAGVILLASGVLAPVGTLVWWLRQGSESLGLNLGDGQGDGPKALHFKQALQQVPLPSQPSPINCYIVFLPGVGDFSADELTAGEEWFLTRLVDLHPNCVVVSDVFPYSAANQDLTGERLLAPLWQAAERGKGWFEVADLLIKIRNLWRFAISADDRYGPVYNRGIASAIIERMDAVYPIARVQGQVSEEQAPPPLNIILLGTSGGVQVALGASRYLDEWLNARLVVVSTGGAFDGENGFDSIDQMYHLRGDRDWVADLTALLFASRWPITVGSPFNQAKQEGRYTVLSSGPHTHDGEEGYFGLATLSQPNSTNADSPDTRYVELTVQVVDRLPIWSTQQNTDQNPEKSAK